VIVLHHGRVVADDTVEALRRMREMASLEEVFGALVERDDPERLAADIAEVAARRA
jgi:ABC-type Na+ transport system ATPase subunit NatA